MGLIEIAESALIFKPEDTVSKVASRMIRESKSEAVIIKNGEYKGILAAGEMAKRKIDNPDKTEIRKFVRKIKTISPEAPLDDVISSMLTNNYKSVPIKTGKKFFILTKLRILDLIKGESGLKNREAKDIMKFPYCISSNDSIETAMSVLREMNVSRLPVINKKGKTEGLIETLDLLRADTRRNRSKLGEGAGEKIHLRGVLINSIMKKNIPAASPNTKIPELINIMLEKNASTVAIEDKGKLSGIITPKLILELVTKEHFRKNIEGVYVRISGLQEEDTFIKSVVDEEIRNEIRKLGKVIPIDYMVLHVKKHKKTGDRQKYSVKGRLITERGYFFASDYGWDITKVIREILHKFEKEIIKKKEKSEVYRRGY